MSENFKGFCIFCFICSVIIGLPVLFIYLKGFEEIQKYQYEEIKEMSNISELKPAINKALEDNCISNDEYILIIEKHKKYEINVIIKNTVKETSNKLELE